MVDVFEIFYKIFADVYCRLEPAQILPLVIGVGERGKVLPADGLLYVGLGVKDGKLLLAEAMAFLPEKPGLGLELNQDYLTECRERNGK